MSRADENAWGTADLELADRAGFDWREELPASEGKPYGRIELIRSSPAEPIPPEAAAWWQIRLTDSPGAFLPGEHRQLRWLSVVRDIVDARYQARKLRSLDAKECAVDLSGVLGGCRLRPRVTLARCAVRASSGPIPMTTLELDRCGPVPASLWKNASGLLKVRIYDEDPAALPEPEELLLVEGLRCVNLPERAVRSGRYDALVERGIRVDFGRGWMRRALRAMRTNTSGEG